ncbi:MAG TPA: diguanylate cyclase [Terriglobia bacterium]|nr:diguanylate cyclase [Terriglobia bacterium]
MNVLIADDEPISRRLLEILLNKWGYDVTVTSNGEEAWQLMQQKEHPKLAILDWMMPGMDGVQVCRKIRQGENGSPTYILLLTAKQEKEDMDGGFRAGADDYLAKPFAAQELKARLRAAKRIVDLEEQLRSVQKTLNIESTLDPLTGLWNRSSILEILHRELHRSRRQRSTIALVMADIDHLRQINLQYGHLAGDAVLREASRRMRGCIRLYDSMGRYGGGQFIIVSPACDQPGALCQAERLRSRTSQQPIETFEGPLPITVSLGVAVGNDEKQAHLLISSAEAALAEAKKSGHNRVEAAVG